MRGICWLQIAIDAFWWLNQRYHLRRASNTAYSLRSVIFLRRQVRFLAATVGVAWGVVKYNYAESEVRGFLAPFNQLLWNSVHKRRLKRQPLLMQRPTQTLCRLHNAHYHPLYTTDPSQVLRGTIKNSYGWDSTILIYSWIDIYSYIIMVQELIIQCCFCSDLVGDRKAAASIKISARSHSCDYE